jgi:hypothetical protein
MARVEDTVVVGKEGPVILTQYPRQLGHRMLPLRGRKGMDEKQFNEILRFGNEKKISSYNLYTMCNQVAKYSGAKELFAELAEEEDKHRKLLEHVSARKVFRGKLGPILDLRISNYLIDVECQSDSSYADILRLVTKSIPSSSIMI